MNEHVENYAALLVGFELRLVTKRFITIKIIIRHLIYYKSATTFYRVSIKLKLAH